MKQTKSSHGFQLQGSYLIFVLFRQGYIALVLGQRQLPRARQRFTYFQTIRLFYLLRYDTIVLFDLLLSMPAVKLKGVTARLLLLITLYAEVIIL